MSCCCAFDQLLSTLKGALCMPEFPFQSGSLSAAIGNVPATTQGTTVTADATANTYGSWTELTAATAFDAQWVRVSLTNNDVASASMGVDIGIGASGSEVVIIPELFFRPTALGSGMSDYLFAVSIPAGSRIAARACQSGSAAETIEVSLNLFSGAAGSPGGGPGVVSTYGGSGAISSAQFISIPATANTDSSWTELTAATAHDHNWLVLATFAPNGAIAVPGRWLIDLAVGASGSEQEIVSDIAISADATLDRSLSLGGLLPIHVPAGSRISARARSTLTTGARSIFVKLYGC